LSKTKIVTLCGSSRFTEAMAACSWLLERDEGVITMGLHLLPGWYSAEPIPDHLAEHEGVADHMDDLHLRKIAISDEIFVVDFANYIGDSTRREINFALRHNKPVRYFTLDLIGRKVQEIIAQAVERQHSDKEVIHGLG